MNISLHRTSGSSILLIDFGSPNPVVCEHNACQVCKFVEGHLDVTVQGITVDTIEDGSSKMPYYNFAAWKEAQKSDTDLKRTYAQLVSGTRSGKKERNLKAVRRY